MKDSESITPPPLLIACFTSPAGTGAFIGEPICDFKKVEGVGKRWAGAVRFRGERAWSVLSAAYLPLTDYPAEQRPEIKAKAVRGIVGLGEGKKRATLLSLISVSLPLNAEEEKEYRELIRNNPEYKEVKMLESVKEVGIEEGKLMGLEEGRSALIAKQIRKKFGMFPEDLQRRLTGSDIETLDRFGEALFDFDKIEDAERWWETVDGDENA